MNAFKQLYQLFSIHSCKSKEHIGIIENCPCVKSKSQVCGDHLTLYIQKRDGVLEELKFQIEGCVIIKASSALMAEFTIGKTFEEIRRLHQTFQSILAGEKKTPEKLNVFSGLHQFPARKQCALLPWDLLLEETSKKS